MIPTYPKIDCPFVRDPATNKLTSDWRRPEFEALADAAWTWTEKVDGTNIRIGIDADGAFHIGGRTDRAEIPRRLLMALRALDLEPKLRAQFDGPVVLYGEGYGGKVQKGGRYRPDEAFVLFDVLVGPWWLRPDDVLDVGVQLGLDVVPNVGSGSLREAIRIVSDGLRSAWNHDTAAEGLVGVAPLGMLDRAGRRLVVKVKARDFVG